MPQTAPITPPRQPHRRRALPLPGLVRALLLATLGALAAAPAAAHPLPERVRALLAEAQVPPEALAAVAIPLPAGPHFGPGRSPGAGWFAPRAWGHQADKPMAPASTMKVVTAAVALDVLGPNHRGFTELRTAAPLQGDTLAGGGAAGALVLRGGADPELGVPQLWALLQDLRVAGVRRIEGDIVLDRSRHRPARPDLGVPPFDEAPEFPYNVIPDALHLAGSLLPIELRGGAAGTPVQAQAVPALPGLRFDTRGYPAASGLRCAGWSEQWMPAVTTPQPDGGTVIELRGKFPADCTRRVELQLLDRSELAERLLRALWAQLGGEWVNGRAREAGDAGVPLAGTRVLARRESRPWGELLRHTVKQSDNAFTRLLYLEIGVAAQARAAAAASAAPPGAAATNAARTTAESADAEVRRWLAAHGIAADGLVMDNGSGLSRSERISPATLAGLLRAAWAGRHATDLAMSLPTAGVDGTLRNRLKGGPAEGWARLKTGTLRDVNALAGYVGDDQGRTWAVAMMINHPRSRFARPALDALVEAIVAEGPWGWVRP